MVATKMETKGIAIARKQTPPPLPIRIAPRRDPEKRWRVGAEHSEPRSSTLRARLRAHHLPHTEGLADEQCSQLESKIPSLMNGQADLFKTGSSSVVP